MVFVIQAFILYQEQNVVDLLVAFYEPVLLCDITYWADVLVKDVGGNHLFPASAHWSKEL